MVHSNKAKPICTAIRPSSKIPNFDSHRNKAKLGRFSLALLPCASVTFFKEQEHFKPRHIDDNQKSRFFGNQAATEVQYHVKHTL